MNKKYIGNNLVNSIENMDKNQLEFLLKQGEGQFIEFKENFDKSLAKEIVAFANSEGGRIFLGITDKKELKGIKITNALKSQIQDLAKHCDPTIKIKMIEFENILIIDVREGEDKPYACSQGFYIRTGPNSQKLTRDEIIEFSISEGKIRFDEQINKNFNYPQDFDEAKLNHYLKLAGLTKNLNVNDILVNLNVAKIIDNELKFNNAGVLFFAKHPERFFLNSKVVCVNYQTNEKVNIIDKKILDNGILSNIQEAIDYVIRHINVEFEIKSARRKEIPQYPLEAYREAIVNAIMHCDYFQKSGNIMVEVFRNKLWIWNPGGLVKWLKPENLGKHSMPRNQIIAELLSKTEYVEKVGSGINRIKTAMKELGLQEPVFEYNHHFLTILNDKIGGKGKVPENSQKSPRKLPENYREILKAIENNPSISRRELASQLNEGEETMQSRLRKLVKDKIIRRIGPDKGGHWEIIEE